LIENLNNISDDLLKAKWYFLAALASLGITYSFILHKSVSWINLINNCLNIKRQIDFESPFLTIAIFVAGFLGNIVFWLISKYSLSHGFLYRIIQGKAAKKEYYFSEKLRNINDDQKEIMERWIKDPSEMKQFYDDGKLKYEFLPDQFYPIFWMSLWAIMVNSALATILLYNNKEYYLYCLLIPMAAIMIANLYYYIIDKINRFIINFCEFKIEAKYNDKSIHFYSLPHWRECLISGLFISLIVTFPLLFIFIVTLPLSLTYGAWILYIFSFIWFFWVPILGIIIHLCKFIFPRFKGFLKVEVEEEERTSLINVNLRCKSFATLRHMSMLLYIIV